MIAAVGVSALFRPLTIKNLTLPNRIVMAPMTRSKSPDGIPGEYVAAYYRRRAKGEVGLIMTEGTYINHPGAGFYPDVPHFHGEEALAGWRRVAESVHAAGGRIFPQLWHCGLSAPAGVKLGPGAVGPSGLVKPGEQVTAPMTQQQIDEVIRAYGMRLPPPSVSDSTGSRFTERTGT
jgi:2,4-dienoyl-CoA reductase-like NADH-dependent reductase (Old Yellow Enzyme family)